MSKDPKDTFAEGKSPEALKLMDEFSRAYGGPGVVASKTHDACMMCGRGVDPLADFTSNIGRAEWRLSHTCESCQNVMFANPED